MAGLYISSSSRNLVLRIAYIVCVLFLLDRLIGSALNFLYFRQISGPCCRLTYILEKSNADIIILGNSRARFHYVPEILAAGLGLSCYNTGLTGEGLPYYLAAFKAITKRYSPQIVILDVPHRLTWIPSDYIRLNCLLPYYRSHPEIQSIVDAKSRFETEKLLVSRIYPFNSLILTILDHNFPSRKGCDKPDYEGYDPLPSKMARSPAVNKIGTAGKTETSEPSADYVAMLHEIISDSKEMGIRLVLVASPICTHRLEDADEYQVIAAANQIPFFDYSADDNFRNRPQLFYDDYHLSDAGARLFSRILADKLRGRDISLTRSPPARACPGVDPNAVDFRRHDDDAHYGSSFRQGF